MTCGHLPYSAILDLNTILFYWMISLITASLFLFDKNLRCTATLLSLLPTLRHNLAPHLNPFKLTNGTEFVNHTTTTFLTSLGITLCLSCPYISPQNGKAERMLRTTNNTIRTMLLHASMPPPYWAEALTTATFLLNRRPSSSIHNQIPHQLLHGTLPDYSSLRVFGCLYYPNLTATSPHKLAP